MQAKKIAFMMTCADNLAIGYFQKQGFHTGLLMPNQLYKGYLKDYEGSTLMECLLDENVDYMKIGDQIREYKKRLHREIELKIQSQVIYEGITENQWANYRKSDGNQIPLRSIPGLDKIDNIEAEYQEIKNIKAGSCFRSNCAKIVEQLKSHKDSWPFINAVKKEEVPDYYDIIKNPMWLTKIEERVNEGKYETKKEFADDLNLIIGNCRSYNQKNTIYYRKSVEIEKYMIQLLANLADDKTVGSSENQFELKHQNAKVKKVKND
jgi:histone acetyltransferase